MHKPQIGFQPQSDLPINGYGLTFETINWFLVQHHVATLPKAVLASNEQTPNAVLTYWQTHANDDLLEQTVVASEVLVAKLAAFSGLIIYDLPVVDDIERQLTADEANRDLLKTINYLYQTPREPEFQRALTSFVNAYASTIAFCDFQA